MVHRRTNALQLLAVAVALSSTFAYAQRHEGAAIGRAGNNWDNFKIFGRGKIVAVNPDVERQQRLEQRQQQRFVPARRRPAPPAPQTPNPRGKATLPLPQPAVPANTAAERYNEISVGRAEVPALRKKAETVAQKIEEVEEILKEAEEAVGNGREGKSLVNTFPFNQRNGGGHHDHQEHHDHHGHGLAPPPPTQSFLAPTSSRFDNRGSRQGQGSDVALDIGTIAAAGERCIDKVVMVEQTEYDDQIDCKHSYTERCFITYKTDYTPQQQEECDENFKKDCFIEFKPRAIEEKVQFCFTPLVRNCNLPSPTECSTEYRSECTTRYHEHDVEDDVVQCETIQEEKCEDVTQGYSTQQRCTKWPRRVCESSRQRVKKYTPETNCAKRPVQICGPGLCPVEAGAEECQEKTETIVQDEPEEVCNLEPQRSCKHVTKLVPHLKPHEDCVDIPKEVCVRSRRNPRKVQKPVVKKWCYTPSRESGLQDSRPENSQGNRPSGQTTRPPVTQQICPRTCERRIRNGQCTPECNIPECPRCVPPPPTCSRTCERNNRNGQCSAQCNVPECPPCVPPRAPTCSRTCERNNRNGQCSAQCNVPECPPCVPPRAPTCSRTCERNNRNGQCSAQCNVPECPPCVPPRAPTCPRQCERNNRNGQCSPQCNIPECPRCVPPPPQCSRQCVRNISVGQCSPECNVPECPKCTPPPPPALYGAPPTGYQG